jgi:hypothetical protein
MDSEYDDECPSGNKERAGRDVQNVAIGKNEQPNHQPENAKQDPRLELHA